MVSAADGQTPLASVELIKQALKPGLTSLPSGAPQPVLYFLKEATTPSCGLLPSEPDATMITSILETEPHEVYPHCLEVTDGAKFQFYDDAGFVFRYRQRDTREDSSTVHFFVLQTSSGLQPIDKLNSETIPLNKSIKYMAAWAKSRMISIENEKDSYVTSLSDSIITDTAILNVSRNEKTGSCRTFMDVVSTQGKVSPVTTTCNTILSTTTLVHGKATYFIVLIETETRKAKGQIFKVKGNTVVESSDLEKHLAPEISSRSILKVKESLRMLLESN
ncbi:MAG: hypothetical protein ACOYL3_23975 [Desulfuromonadaceae bacterium]